MVKDVEDLPAHLTWEYVKDAITTLPGQRGFGENIEILGYKVEMDGTIWAVTPKNWQEFSEPIANAQVIKDLYRILYFYAKSADTPLPETEHPTKVSRLRGGSLQCSTNQHRMEARFRSIFEKDPAGLERLLLETFHATPANYGDRAFKVPLLPRVPLWMIYNGAEEEEGGLVSDVNLLFDASAIDYLPQFLCENIENLFLLQVERLLAFN